jgi:hypothetical protein
LDFLCQPQLLEGVASLEKGHLISCSFLCFICLFRRIYLSNFSPFGSGFYLPSLSLTYTLSCYILPRFSTLCR